MAGRAETRVIDVTPRSRAASLVGGFGIVVEATGWLLAAAAAIQGLSTAVTVALAAIVVILGRRLRSR